VTERRNPLRGFGVLALAMLATQVVGFVALAYASRELGPEDLGAANFALNAALYFAIPANFGLAILGVRDVAREPGRAAVVVGEVLSLRLALGVALTVLMIVLAPVVASDPQTRELLPLAAIAVLAGQLSGEFALLGLEASKPVALARIAGQGVYAVLVLLALGTGDEGARAFVLYSALSILITSLVTLVAAVRRVGRPRLTLHRPRLSGRLIASAPLGVVVVMIQVYQTIGALLLGYLDSAAAVGQYAVAHKIPLVLYGVMDLWSAMLYPSVTRLAGVDDRALAQEVGRFMTLSLAVAVPLAVGGALVADDLLPLLFGAAYDGAGGAFAILLAGFGLALVTVNPGSALAAGGDERRYAVALVAGAFLTVAAGLALVPAAGPTGAALATVIAEVVILAFVLRRFTTLFGRPPLDAGRLVRVAGLTAVMAGAMVAVGAVAGVVVQVLAGAAVVLAGAPLLGIVRRSDVR
jgi:O-antigen/teichoic acid export membrane protein